MFYAKHLHKCFRVVDFPRQRRGCKNIVQESRAVARKPRDAAAVLFHLKFADKFIASLRAKLRKPGFTAPNIPAQNRI